MDHRSTAEKYFKSGLTCLPTNETKAPNMSRSWKDDFAISDFQDCHGIGVICGERSGGMECFDFDNHAKDARENLTEFMAIPEVKEIYEKYNMPIERTVSGGFHLFFRCTKNEGNRKLASKMLDGKPDCFIETRGEGGYFCVSPTPGYFVVKNDILNIPVISEIDRAILFDNAISLNQHFVTIKTEYENTDRPGDIYNSESSAIEEMKSILKQQGWSDLGGTRWRRPGKKEGISATLGKVAPNIFYVFSSNTYPFEPNKGYTPFQVLGLIKYNGDFKEAAKSIAPDKPIYHKIQKGIISESEIEKILLSAKIDTKKHIEKPPTILTIRNQNGTSYKYERLLTLGNFSCIIGKAKSRKTFFLTMVAAALIKTPEDEKFIGEMPENKNEILYFDTEQGEYDSYNVIKRIERMTINSPRLRAYNLRPYSPIERCQIIEYAFKIYGDRVGYCVIDGIADLANGINDEEEATRVVTILLRLSKVHNCHISTVIHQNKNDGFATGHLGSSIMKKAEIIISVTKKDNSYSEIKCDMSRGVGFDDFYMTISDDGIPEVAGIGFKPSIPTDSIYESSKKEDSEDVYAPYSKEIPF